MDAQLAFLQAAWALNPVHIMMRQQAAVWRGLTSAEASRLSVHSEPVITHHSDNAVNDLSRTQDSCVCCAKTLNIFKQFQSAFSAKPPRLHVHEQGTFTASSGYLQKGIRPMAAKNTRRAKTPNAKKPRAGQSRAKAISGKDPVKSEPRATTGRLIDAQLAFLQAAWALNPVHIMMEQQAAVWRGLTSAEVSTNRAKRKSTRSVRQHRT
jgi:hypothetical protein